MRILTLFHMDTITAYRVVEVKPAVGEKLEASYVWAGDEPTSERLQGTSCWASLAKAREYGRYSKGFWVIAVEGERVMAGELAGEVVVRDAVVTEIVCEL